MALTQPDTGAQARESRTTEVALKRTFSGLQERECSDAHLTVESYVDPVAALQR